ncbi:hypothetical protein TWF281_010232 [Arthrobotrys megalospora]
MTDLKPGDQAQWTWGQGHPTGTVAEVTDHGSLSIQSSNGNTITRNADPSNPAVQLQQDSGTDVVKRASELEKLPSTSSDAPEEPSGGQLNPTSTDGNLRKPFPAPRQSAPISRPPDTAQEKEEAKLSLEQQARLAEERNREVEAGSGGGGGQTTIHGHTNGEPVTQSAGSLMDIREEVAQAQEPSSEKQPTVEASVGEKRGRSEEPPAADSSEQPTTSGSAKNGELNKVTPATIPEPETKKPRVEEPAAAITDPTGAVPTESEVKPGTAGSSEPPKKKAGRPKKEEIRAVPGERKNSISSRTRSKATAEDVSI